METGLPCISLEIWFSSSFKMNGTRSSIWRQSVTLLCISSKMSQRSSNLDKETPLWRNAVHLIYNCWFCRSVSPFKWICSLRLASAWAISTSLVSFNPSFFLIPICFTGFIWLTITLLLSADMLNRTASNSWTLVLGSIPFAEVPYLLPTGGDWFSRFAFVKFQWKLELLIFWAEKLKYLTNCFHRY